MAKSTSLKQSKPKTNTKAKAKAKKEPLQLVKSETPLEVVRRLFEPWRDTDSAAFQEFCDVFRGELKGRKDLKLTYKALARFARNDKKNLKKAGITLR